MKNAFTFSLAGILIWLGIVCTAVAAYIHHVVFCIQQQEWIMLAFGLIPPIGVIHGIGLWLGWFAI